MKWIDSVSLQLHANVLSCSKHEPVLDNAIAELILTCRDQFEECFANTPNIPSIGYLVSTYPDSHGTLPWNRVLIRPVPEAKKTEDILSLLKDPEILGFSMNCDEKALWETHAVGITEYGKRYRDLFLKRNNDISPADHKEEVCDMFNCCDPGLKGISLPITVARNIQPFDFYTRTKEMYGNPKKKWILSSEDTEKRPVEYEHYICINVSRSMIRSQTDLSRLASSWKSIMMRICDVFPYAKASVDLDTPRDQVTWNEFLRPDYDILDFARYIPGYPWGLFITAEQAKLFGRQDRSELQSIYSEVKELKSGGLYLQLTSRIDDVGKDSLVNVKGFLRQYLHPVRHIRPDDRMPTTLRAGCMPEEYDFSYYSPHTQRRSLAEAVRMVASAIETEAASPGIRSLAKAVRMVASGFGTEADRHDGNDGK